MDIPPGPNPVTLTRRTSQTLHVKGEPGTCRPAQVTCTVWRPTASGVYVAVYRPSPDGDSRDRTVVPPGPATYTVGSPAVNNTHYSIHSIRYKKKYGRLCSKKATKGDLAVSYEHTISESCNKVDSSTRCLTVYVNKQIRTDFYSSQLSLAHTFC